MCTCNKEMCDSVTIRLAKIHDHMPTHDFKVSQYDRQTRPLWETCMLQTYFTAKGLINYFVVLDEGDTDGRQGEEGRSGYSGTPGGGPASRPCLYRARRASLLCPLAVIPRS